MNNEQEIDNLKQKLIELEDQQSKATGEAERVAIRSQISSTHSNLADLYTFYNTPKEDQTREDSSRKRSAQEAFGDAENKTLISDIYNQFKKIEENFISVKKDLTYVKKDLTSVKKYLTSVKKDISLSAAQSLEANFAVNNPWNNLSKKSGSLSEPRNNLQRQSFLAHYGMTPQTQFCMLTGKNGTLKLAHLLPVNVKPVIVKSLSMLGQINDFRNNLMLSENIEIAFDNQRISFVPSPDIFKFNEFVMKIWDESVRDEYIYKNATGSNTKISELEGFTLKLDMPNGLIHYPFKRCLAFHSFMCFMKWSIYHGKIQESINDFGSEHAGTWLKERQFYFDSLNKRLNEGTSEQSDDYELFNDMEDKK